MTQAPWPPRFEQIVREHLPALAAEDALTQDLVLADHGLNSLRTVNLLVSLEDGFAVTLPDELLAGTTFATAGALWSVFAQLTGDRA
jgi:acyl carrier protein